MDAGIIRFAKIFFSGVLSRRPAYKKELGKELATAILEVVESEEVIKLGDLSRLALSPRSDTLPLIALIAIKRQRSEEEIRDLEYKLDEAGDQAWEREKEIYHQNNPVPEDIYERIAAVECYNRKKVIEGIRQQLQKSSDLDWGKIEEQAYHLIDEGHIFDAIRVLQGMRKFIQDPIVQELILFAEADK